MTDINPDQVAQAAQAAGIHFNPGWISLFVLGSMILGRAWHAWTSGGGLNGIKNSFLFGTNAPKQPTKQESTQADNIAAKVGLFFLCGLLAIGSVGCKATLEPGGAYTQEGRDIDLFYADQSFYAAYQIVDQAFLWERDNRELVWKLSPEIKHAIDKVRPKAWEIEQRYIAARKAYELSPSQQNGETLNSIVLEMRKMAAAASAAITPTATNGN